MEFCLKWFGHVGRKHVEVQVRRVNQMEGSSIARGRGRPRKVIGETIKKDLDFSALTVDMIYDGTL